MFCLKTISIIFFSISFLWATDIIAAPCDRLSSDQHKLAQKLFQLTYPYDCCDETLERCLKQAKVCKLAKRLRDDICLRILKGHDEKKIQNALDRRARSMTSMGKKASFDLSKQEPAGDPKAPVIVVAYACARCPFCSRVIPDLYRLVTQSGLKGKVKLYFRPFPIRGHEGSTEGGLAFIASQTLGKFWPFLSKLYSEYDHFSIDKLPTWAASVGLDEKSFQQSMGADEIRTLLVNSKKEGLRNGVDATPTLFINGRKYFGDMDSESLLDVLDEEADRMQSKQFCGK